MPDKKLTDELLNELLDAPNIDGYIKEHDFAAPSLSDYLKQLLQEKGLERSRVVRMADGVSVLNCKDRRDAIIIFCIDRGCSLQKVNEELYRFGEETVS